MPDVGSITTVLRDVTRSHGPGTGEENLVEHFSLTELIDHHFDFSNLSQVNTTIIRVFEKADGIVYRQIGESRIYPTDYGTDTRNL